MRGNPAAAADSPSSLSALLVLVVPACTTPGAAGAAVAAAADGSALLLPPPNTLAQSSGVTPIDAGTRSDATLLAVAYFDRSSTSFGAKLRGTPQPTGATEREECGRPLLLELLRGAAFFPNSSTRPAIERWPSPGGVCALGADPAAAAALPTLQGDATLSARGATTGCCCCCCCWTCWAWPDLLLLLQEVVGHEGFHTRLPAANEVQARRPVQG